MTKREATAVAKQISKRSGVRVTGYRVERTRGGQSWAVECVDTVTGYPFIAWSREDWLERLAAAEFAGV